MSQDYLVKFQCTECKRITHWSRKNKKKLSEVKLAPKKHCRWCMKHTLHKEVKK